MASGNEMGAQKSGGCGDKQVGPTKRAVAVAGAAKVAGGVAVKHGPSGGKRDQKSGNSGG